MTITAVATDEPHDRDNCGACQNANGTEVVKHLEELYDAPAHEHRFVDTPDGRRCYDCGEPVKLSDAQDVIVLICDEIKEMLLEKNRKYGNSALNPINVFSRKDPKEQINVRIDDKLNRVRNQQVDEDEDVDGDLIGYLILRKVHDRINDDGTST